MSFKRKRRKKMAAISGSKDKTSASGVEFLSKDIDFYKFTGYTAVHTNAGDADSVYHLSLIHI